VRVRVRVNLLGERRDAVGPEEGEAAEGAHGRDRLHRGTLARPLLVGEG